MTDSIQSPKIPKLPEVKEHDKGRPRALSSPRIEQVKVIEEIVKEQLKNEKRQND